MRTAGSISHARRWPVAGRMLEVMAVLILGALLGPARGQSATGSLVVYIYPGEPLRDLAAEWRLAARTGNRATATVPTGGNWWVWLQVIGDTSGTAWARCYVNGEVKAERTGDAERGVMYYTFGIGPAYPPGTELAIAISDGQLNVGSQIVVQNEATGEVRVLFDIATRPGGLHGARPRPRGASPPSAWNRSGELVSGIPAGDHTIEFKDLPGWVKPPNQNVTIRAGQTTTLNATYTSEAAQRVSVWNLQAPLNRHGLCFGSGHNHFLLVGPSRGPDPSGDWECDAFPVTVSGDVQPRLTLRTPSPGDDLHWLDGRFWLTDSYSTLIFTYYGWDVLVSETLLTMRSIKNQFLYHAEH